MPYTDLITNEPFSLNTADPQWSWLYNDKLWRGPMTPEHEKLFSLLAVFMRVASHARRSDLPVLCETLDKLKMFACRALDDVGPRARVTLRTRTAVEAIVERLLDARDPYQAIEFVQRAAEYGTGKSRLLDTVTDKTWREQIAGRAQLAIKRDWPEFDLRW